MSALPWPIALLLLAGSFPFTSAEDSVRERNAAWVLSQWTGYDPDGVGTLHLGATSSIQHQRELLSMVLDRFGELDASDLASAAVNGEFPAVGDIWLFEIGADAACPVPVVLAPVGAPSFVTTPEDHILYDTDFQGYATSEVSIGGWGEAIEWWTYTAWTYNTRVTYGTNSDFFCFETPGFTLNFPFIDGVATEVAP